MLNLRQELLFSFFIFFSFGKTENDKDLLRNSDYCGRDTKDPTESFQLTCSKDQKHRHMSHINVTHYSHSFPKDCPCVYDSKGLCQQTSQVCTSPTSDFYCNFRLKNVIISKEGGLLDCRTLSTLTFSHPTMYESPTYDPTLNKKFKAYFEKAAAEGLNQLKIRKMKAPEAYDMVVPTRMIWDNHFSHLSFQAIPFIAHVKEFNGEIWDKLTWHASVFTAAILRLLDVPEERIIIEKAVFARTIVLPWLPNWTPSRTATFHGIAAGITSQMTSKLIALYSHKSHIFNRSFNNNFQSNFNRDNTNNTNKNPNIKSSKKKDFCCAKILLSPLSGNSTKRLILYLTRRTSVNRAVVNEEELLNSIRSSMHPDYELIVIGSTPEYKTIDMLHESWFRYADVFRRARVIIGPHGGGMNNLMWAPDDVDIIEFNLFRTTERASEAHGGTAVRSCFSNAAWAKGGKGKFWIVPPSTMENKNFYSGNMRVAPSDVLEILQRIGMLKKKSSGGDKLERVRSKSSKNKIDKED